MPDPLFCGRAAAASLMLLAAFPAHAEETPWRGFAHLDNTGSTAAGWGSREAGRGHAVIELSPDRRRIAFLQLVLDGVPRDVLADAGGRPELGPIHIHNHPQGGPQFFVLQLPGSYAEIDGTTVLTLRDWEIEAPLGGAQVTPEFVVAEILAGNAYFGVHTHNQLCHDRAGQPATCAAPATALSGDILPIAAAGD